MGLTVNPLVNDYMGLTVNPPVVECDALGIKLFQLPLETDDLH